MREIDLPRRAERGLTERKADVGADIRAARRRVGIPSASAEASETKPTATAEEVAEATLFLAKQNENAFTMMTDIRPLVPKR